MKPLNELGISPAPWSINVVHDELVGDYAYIKNGNGDDIHCDYDGEFSLPDARLIAAAPELYEALRKLLDYLSLNNWTDRELDPYIEAADDALAKAGGESEAAK